MDEGSKINPADIRDLIGKDWSPERLRFGVGVRGCEIPDEKNIAASHQGEAAKNFWAVRLSRARHWWDWLRCPAGRAEWRGDFVKPRMELDCLRQLLNAEINGAAANLVAVGVGVNPF